MLEAHQVAQREAVVGADEIDAGGGRPPAVVKLPARGRKAVGEAAPVALPLQPPAAQGVAVLVVPFAPAGREGAQLVAAGADVPGLGDPLEARQQRVGLQRGEQPGQLLFQRDRPMAGMPR